MKKLKTEAEFKHKKQGVKALVFVGLIILALSVIRIYLANLAVDYSGRLHNLELQEQTLVKENTILNTKLSTANSLIILTTKAQEAGFVAISKVVYIQTPSQTAWLP